MSVQELEEIIEKYINLIKHKACVDRPATPSEGSVTVSVHSPVDIHLFDSRGRHTGIVSATGTDLRIVEKKIPNSSYTEFGDGKYITAPLASSTVVLDGIGTGTFTLVIEKKDAASTTVTTFSDIPVTALSTGNLSLGEGVESILKVDVDGDGAYDATTTAASSTDPFFLIKTIRVFITTSTLSADLKDALLAQLAIIEKNVVKDKDRALSTTKDTIARITTGQGFFKNMDPLVRKALLDSLGRLLIMLDKKTMIR